MPQGNQAWWDIHLYWKYFILPAIKDIHVDHYWRYDMWLQDPKSKLKKENAIKFSELIMKV